MALISSEEHDLNVKQGETSRDPMVWKTGATIEDGIVVDPGTPVPDIDTYTARMQIRKTKKSATVLYEVTESGGDNPQDIINLGPADGSVEIVIDPASSAAWKWRAAVYDLELYAPGGGDTKRLVAGSVFVSDEVTR